jgi:hypothetical protein
MPAVKPPGPPPIITTSYKSSVVGCKINLLLPRSS